MKQRTCLVIFLWFFSIHLTYSQLVISDTLLHQVSHKISQDTLLRSCTRVCLVDFSRPSYEKRLWIWDISTGTCLLHTWVAHGKGSGRTAYATVFSNASQSYCSSLGVFIPKGRFDGIHGLSLRLQGIEPGINDQAEVRGIIFHTAPYVSEYNATVRRRQGNSWGCFVVPETDLLLLINLLENTQSFVWAIR